MDYEWIEKTILKKSDKKNKKKTENQRQNAACEQKNHQRENKIQFKQKPRPRMSCEWIGKTI